MRCLSLQRWEIFRFLLTLSTLRNANSLTAHILPHKKEEAGTLAVRGKGESSGFRSRKEKRKKGSRSSDVYKVSRLM